MDEYIITYLDNILIYSARALDNYIKKVYKIFKYFSKKNLRLKLEKYQFYQKEIEFIEYIIERDRIYINP